MHIPPDQTSWATPSSRSLPLASKREKMAYPQWLLTILKIGFVLSSFLLLSPATRAQSVSSAACATGVHAILARGQGAGNDLDVLTSIQSLLLGSINGSTSTALPYAYNSSDKVAAVHNGALLLQEYVQEYVSSCPDSKIFILGYSLVRHRFSSEIHIHGNPRLLPSISNSLLGRSPHDGCFVWN